MKLNIQVELEWIDEEGNLDEQVRNQIISGVVARVSRGNIEEAERAAKEAIRTQVAATIDNQIIKITEELLAGEFDVTDRWGEVKVHQTTVKKELKKELDAFLTQKVDKDGRPQPDGYGSYDTRINWLIQRTLLDKYTGLKKEVEQVSAKIQAELKEYVDSLLKAQLGEGIAKAIGLDAIINGKKN